MNKIGWEIKAGGWIKDDNYQKKTPCIYRLGIPSTDNFLPSRLFRSQWEIIAWNFLNRLKISQMLPPGENGHLYRHFPPSFILSPKGKKVPKIRQFSPGGKNSLVGGEFWRWKKCLLDRVASCPSIIVRCNTIALTHELIGWCYMWSG